MSTFALHILTPTEPFWQGDVSLLTVPLLDGAMQFLAHHSEELSALADGAAYYDTPDGNRVDFCTSGGVVYFDGVECWLLCEHAAKTSDWNDEMQAHAATMHNETARRKQSMQEHRLGTIALNKAFVTMRGKTIRDLDD